MDEIIIKEQDIDFEEQDNPEYLGNKVLYDMCKLYPNHTNNQEIFAKIWIIGRSYAAALERNNSKNKNIDVPNLENDEFYLDAVNTIRKSQFDADLKDIKKYPNITKDNIEDIFNVYKKLIDITDKFKRGQKHSFCSKYLHFHFPNLFFIYDSRARDSIFRCNIKIDRSYRKILEKYRGLPYFRFFIQCFILKEEIYINFGKELTPRQIDIFLVQKANEKGKNK